MGCITRIGFLVWLISVTLASESVAETRITPFVAGGLTAGGDTIATYTVVYLGDEFLSSVDAGETGYLFGGVNLMWPKTGLGLQLQGGLFGGGVGIGENSVDLTRYPVELIGTFERGKWRAGIGVTRHNSPKFEDKTDTPFTLDFKDASGTVIQLDYLFERFSVGLRRVEIDYELPFATLDASHWGLNGEYRFGRSRE